MRGIDVDRVTEWLSANIAQITPPFEYSLIAGGRSNLTFLVTDANGERVVLRRPPLGHVLATAHDMAREHRIITGVARAGTVPVAPTLGLCADEQVNGAPFYVMGFIEGDVLDSPDKVHLLAEELRGPASEDLIDVLAALHDIDPDAVGLGDLGRREGYIERQLRRWSTQWANSKTREVAAIEEVERRLRANMPEQMGTVIAHGDYRFGNCMIDTATGRVAGVLDWELCTLGDPLADVGYLGVYWTDVGHPVFRSNDPSGAPGFPNYSDLLERYASVTGRDLSGIDYYVAFSNWRLAVISEGVYARYLNGAMGDDLGQALDPLRVGVEQLAEAALKSARTLG